MLASALGAPDKKFAELFVVHGWGGIFWCFGGQGGLGEGLGGRDSAWRWKRRNVCQNDAFGDGRT